MMFSDRQGDGEFLSTASVAGDTCVAEIAEYFRL